MNKRRKYDRDFKRNAVLLCSEPGRTVTEVAENLGIAEDMLYRWRREYHLSNGKLAFPGMVSKLFHCEQAWFYLKNVA